MKGGRKGGSVEGGREGGRKCGVWKKRRKMKANREEERGSERKRKSRKVDEGGKNIGKMRRWEERKRGRK